MKTPLRLFSAVIAALWLAGCATSVPVGGLYTDVNLPLQATSASGGSKTGTAVCTSVLSLLATGDCSIAAAKADGGIHHRDPRRLEGQQCPGNHRNYTLTVTGE